MHEKKITSIVRNCHLWDVAFARWNREIKLTELLAKNLELINTKFYQNSLFTKWSGCIGKVGQTGAKIGVNTFWFKESGI